MKKKKNQLVELGSIPQNTFYFPLLRKWRKEKRTFISKSTSIIRLTFGGNSVYIHKFNSIQIESLVIHELVWFSVLNAFFFINHVKIEIAVESKMQVHSKNAVKITWVDRFTTLLLASCFVVVCWHWINFMLWHLQRMFYPYSPPIYFFLSLFFCIYFFIFLVIFTSVNFILLSLTYFFLLLPHNFTILGNRIFTISKKLTKFYWKVG